MTIGVVIGESKPTEVTAQSSKPLAVGEYVIVDSQWKAARISRKVNCFK